MWNIFIFNGKNYTIIIPETLINMNIETECFKKVVIVIYKEELQMEKELKCIIIRFGGGVP